MLRCKFALGMLIIMVVTNFLVAGPTWAADVRGIIDTDTTWMAAESPYLITGNIQVAEDVRLIIEPGVIVTFQDTLDSSAGFYIAVEGTLQAQGTVDNPIIFTALDRLSRWGASFF